MLGSYVYILYIYTHVSLFVFTFSRVRLFGTFSIAVQVQLYQRSVNTYI